jgi:hypothetical protein
MMSEPSPLLKRAKQLWDRGELQESMAAYEELAKGGATAVISLLTLHAG